MYKTEEIFNKLSNPQRCNLSEINKQGHKIELLFDKGTLFPRIDRLVKSLDARKYKTISIGHKEEENYNYIRIIL